MARQSSSNLLNFFNPIAEFFKNQQLSGYLLLIATIIAIVTANSSYGDAFISFWQTPVGIYIGEVSFKMTFESIINDGLMTVFFIVVGLEIKREFIEGELSTRQKAMLPIIGALGGMLFPAIIFSVFNYGKTEISGWAIPTATDIAFSLTVVSLLGNKVPLSLKVFLTALAVVDDLGAIVIIGIFYSHDTHLIYLLYAFIVIAILIVMNKKDVKNIYLYMFVGIFLWNFLHHAGVHATISGVILALTIPFRFKNYESMFNQKLKKVISFSKMLDTPEGKKDHSVRDQIIEEMQKVSTQMEAPLNNMLYLLSSFSGLIIMPLFALSNAGIKLDFNALGSLTSTMSLGIIFGLMLGKPLGITITTWVTTKLKITSIPDGVKWTDVFCVNILAGIGFTMSIFVTKLAYIDKSYIETAKFSIIIASVLSGLIGYIVLYILNPNKKIE